MGIKNKLFFSIKALSIFILFSVVIRIQASEHDPVELSSVQPDSKELDDALGEDVSLVDASRKLGRVDSLDMYPSRDKNSETGSRSSGKKLSYAFAGTFNCDDEEAELSGGLKRSETIYVNAEFAKEYRKTLESGSDAFGNREYSVFSTSVEAQEVVSEQSFAQSKPLQASLALSQEAQLIVDELDEGGSMIGVPGHSISLPMAKRELLAFAKININDGESLAPVNSHLRAFSQVSLTETQGSSDNPQNSVNPLSVPTQESGNSDRNGQNVSQSVPMVMIYNKKPDASLDRLSCWQQVLNCFCCKGNEKE